MPIDPQSLAAVADAGDLFTLLRDDLGWPVEGVPTLDFYEEPEIAAGVKGGVGVDVYTVVPAGDEDERLIVLAEFRGEYVRKDLRELLRSLRGTMRNTARWGEATDAHDTLFIVATPGYDDVRFVLFEEAARRLPRIRSFGWSRHNVGRTVLTYNLDKLHWSSRARWDEAWNVEGLTDEFYDARNRAGGMGLVQVFDRFLELTTHPGGEKPKRAFVQHLVNRLLFVSFVERMGWLKPPAGESATTDYLKWLWERHKALKAAGEGYAGFVDHAYQAPSSFKSLLDHLFFNGLNDPQGIAEGHRYHRLLGFVPYLNGGLFEEDTALDVPGVAVEDEAFGLLFDDRTGLFRRFNFTVTESTPLDEEVAVDPEMLGKIFERLIIREDRHLTGTYYTPRPIVEYMVNEAIKGYLVDRGLAPEKAALLVDEDKVESSPLPSGGEGPGVRVAFLPSEMQDALDWLFEVRAVDPACGSGAYLLMLLQRLFDLVDRLEVVRAKRRTPNAKGLYETKLRLLQRCVYGVDQSEVAVRIARLRMWLSLVVENRGEVPEPLPSFDYLIMAGDSLASPLFPAQAALGYPHDAVREYTRLKGRFFHPKPGEVRPTRAAMAAKRAEIATAMEEGLAQSGLRSLAANPFDWEVEFAEVFDPEEDAATVDGRLNLGPSANRNGQGELAARAARPPGFDIVLANPPYVNSGELLRSVGEGYKKALVKAYPKTGSGTADLLIFFFERALGLLRPGGQLAFITSNKWLKAGYGKGLRGHLAAATGVRRLVDFGDLPVFQNVIAYPLVTIAAKGGTGPTELTTVTSLDAPYPDVPAVVLASSGRLGADALGRDGTWRLEAEGDDRLARMRARGVPLGEYVKGRIYRGILTGLNEVKIGSDGRMYGKSVPQGVRVVRKEGVFVIDGAKRAELIAEDPNSAEIIKPLAVGKDVRRWRVEDNDRWLIVTRIGTDMTRYPAVMAHLAKYEDLLRPRADQGNHWWELRACAYYDAFEDAKIAYPDMSQEARFSLVEAGVYLPNTAYIIPVSDPYLLGVLNSRSFNEQLDSQLNKNIGDTSRSFTDKMKHAAVPRPRDADRQAIEKVVFVLLAEKRKDAEADVSSLEAEIDRRVEFLYFGDAANRSYDEAMDAARGAVRALLRKPAEDATLEFKETLWWDVRQATFHNDRVLDVAKAICAMINREGGTILVGVRDEGNAPVGIARDLERLGTPDAFQRKVAEPFGVGLKPDPSDLVRVSFVDLDGVTLARIDVQADRTSMYALNGKVVVRRDGESRVLDGPDLALWWGRRTAGQA